LAIVLSVLLRYTNSDYPFGIFKLGRQLNYIYCIVPYRFSDIFFCNTEHDLMLKNIVPKMYTIYEASIKLIFLLFKLSLIILLFNWKKKYRLSSLLPIFIGNLIRKRNLKIDIFRLSENLNTSGYIFRFL
jgi:hypothetical protein